MLKTVLDNRVKRIQSRFCIKVGISESIAHARLSAMKTAFEQNIWQVRSFSESISCPYKQFSKSISGRHCRMERAACSRMVAQRLEAVAV